MSENYKLILSLKNANIFQKDNLVLSDVNIDIGTGEFVYLIGKTGSGKSSILKTCYGELPFTDGEGSIAGFDLKNLKRKQIPDLRRKLGIVFQDFELLMDRSVNENLYFVMRATGWKDRKEIEERAKAVLDSVQLGTKGFKMPHELSGGEQQRVVIARALINDPELILADEPTGNLDPQTTEEILALLFDIARSGRAILMATHDYTYMQKFSSRTITCQNNKVLDSKNELLHQEIQ